MHQISVHRGADRSTTLIRKNTSRVPGITRNSGWQAVDADIVRIRMIPLSTVSGEDVLGA